jgi:hypothetical protein
LIALPGSDVLEISDDAVAQDDVAGHSGDQQRQCRQGHADKDP